MISVAVVGSGIAGHAICRELLKRNFHVTLVVPKHFPGSATRASQGISAIKGLFKARSNLFHYKMAGHRYLFQWAHDLEMELHCKLPKVLGAFETFGSESEEKALRKRIYGDEVAEFRFQPLWG